MLDKRIVLKPYQKKKILIKATSKAFRVVRAKIKWSQIKIQKNVVQLQLHGDFKTLQ